MKRNSVAGFMLLELVLYIALSMVSIGLISSLLPAMYGAIDSSIRATDVLLHAHFILECIKKDIVWAQRVQVKDQNSLWVYQGAAILEWQCASGVIRICRDSVQAQVKQRIGSKKFSSTFRQKIDGVLITVSCGEQVIQGYAQPLGSGL